MKKIENMTKAELLEFIDKKEGEIIDLKDRLAAVEELEVYNDVADKIKGMYDKLVDKGFYSDDAIELVETMISSGIINNRRPVSYVSYNRYR